MLRLMRENAGSWIIKILLGIIVIVFIFLGIGPERTPTENIAATVNKQVISMDEYRQVFNLIRSQYGKNMNEELIKALGLKGRALESMIDSELILQESEKLGINAADEELAEILTEAPIFQDNGKFSKENYERYLKYMGQQITDFESRQKKQLIEQKFRRLLTDSVQVTETEAKEWFLWEKAKVALDYVLFKPSAYKDLKPTEEQVKSYYEKNREKYKSDPQMSVSYLCFSPKDYTDKAIVTDEEIQAWYNNNISRYEEEKTVEARHILIKVAKDAEPVAVETARKKAEDIYKKAVEEKQDFSELAKTFSEDSSKANGGSLGVFTRDSKVKPFADKAFSMKAGEISEPVRSTFGWHIIKVEKINEATRRELGEVKEEIKTAIIKEKTENLAYEDSEEVFNLIVIGGELADISETRNLKLVKTEMFTKAAGPLEVRATARWDFANEVFGMSVKEISDVLEFKGSYYIVQVDGKKPSEIQPFENVKAKITAAVRKELRGEKAGKDAEALLAALKSGEKELSGEKDLRSTGLFTRDSNGTEAKVDREVIAAAFQLKDKWADKPVRGAKGYYVISLKERLKPLMSEFKNEKDRIIKLLTERKKDAAVKEWLARARMASDIERNPHLIN